MKYRVALMPEKILSRKISVLAGEDEKFPKRNFKYRVDSKSVKSLESDLDSFKKRPNDESGSFFWKVVDAPNWRSKSEVSKFATPNIEWLRSWCNRRKATGLASKGDQKMKVEVSLGRSFMRRSGVQNEKFPNSQSPISDGY